MTSKEGLRRGISYWQCASHPKARSCHSLRLSGKPCPPPCGDWADVCAVTAVCGWPSNWRTHRFTKGLCCKAICWASRCKASMKASPCHAWCRPWCKPCCRFACPEGLELTPFEHRLSALSKRLHTLSKIFCSAAGQFSFTQHVFVVMTSGYVVERALHGLCSQGCQGQHIVDE